MDFIVYSICFGVGLLFTLITAVAGHLFGGNGADSDLGTGGHAEAGFDHSGMPGLAPFSPTIIACFITAFGSFGIIFARIEATKNPLISGPLALLDGFAVAGCVLEVSGDLIFVLREGLFELLL